MTPWMTPSRVGVLAAALIASLAACTVADKSPASSADSLQAGDTTAAASSDSAPSAGALTVTETGIGPVRAGMTIGQVNAALSGILRIPRKLNECDYLGPASGPRNFMLMVEKGRVARVDVPDSSGISTAAGARVGDSEARIMSLYSGRVKVQPHKYTSGHYLVVTPANRADSAFRIVFETDGSKVVRYRSGRRPAVEYVEGCA